MINLALLNGGHVTLRSRCHGINGSRHRAKPSRFNNIFDTKH